MPQIESWSRVPVAIRDHLVERMQDRNVSLHDLNRLRLWMETKSEVPERPWYTDFGSFKLCGETKSPKTFLTRGQQPLGADCKDLRTRNAFGMQNFATSFQSRGGTPLDIHVGLYIYVLEFATRVLAGRVRAIK
jgi:hypothetical protein